MRWAADQPNHHTSAVDHEESCAFRSYQVPSRRKRPAMGNGRRDKPIAEWLAIFRTRVLTFIKGTSV